MKVSKLYEFDGLSKIPVKTASIGSIVAISGITDIHIGDTLCSPENPQPIPFQKISEPTIAMHFIVNDSPFAGQEGKFVTSRLQECMVRLSFLYLTSITNRLGIYAASAVGVASKYDIFAMLPATSIANALTAITAQNYGAGKPERARKSLLAGLTFALAASSLFWLWAQLSPQTMIAVFSQDPAIIKTGIPFFTACSYDYLAVTLVFCMNGYLNGRSQTIFTIISSCFGALILRIPLIYLVSTHTPDNLTRIGSIAPAVSFFMAAYTSLYLIHSYRHEKRAMSQSTH